MISSQHAITLLKTSGRQEWHGVASPYGSGLYIRLLVSGRKQWFYRYTLDKKTQDVRIGNFPSISVEEALELHAELVGLKGEGIDLQAFLRHKIEDREREAVIKATDSMTNGHLFTNWIEHYATIPSARTRRIPTKTTVQRTRRRWELHAPGWFQRQAVSATARRHINEIVTRAAKKAREEARKLVSTLNLMYDYAEDIGIIETNPCIGVKPAKLGASSSPPRPDYLELPQVKFMLDYLFQHTQLFHFAGVKPPTRTSEPMALILLMLFYTGQRRSDVFFSTPREFEIDNRRWQIPAERYKSRRMHSVPLTDTTIAIVERAMSLAGESGRVFDWSSRRKGYSKGVPDNINQALNRLLEQKAVKACVPRFTPHDLRRTISTNAADHLNADEMVLDRILGHLPQDKLIVTYQRAKKWKQQVKVMEEVSDLWDAQVGIEKR